MVDDDLSKGGLALLKTKWVAVYSQIHMHKKRQSHQPLAFFIVWLLKVRESRCILL